MLFSPLISVQIKPMTLSGTLEQSVRTLPDEKGMVWFVGKDVAEALGYKDTATAVKDHVDEEDKTTRRIAAPSRGKQMTTMINESGVYSLIFSSKLPKAKEFKHWVTSKVLPEIRKYFMPVRRKWAFFSLQVNTLELHKKIYFL